ncbi:MAG: Cof-type HAD-IIB family hydrolase [Bacillota bacterium]|nr:Cof-type HAD-IIB family hydrolase [Bacillota bacterium]
MKISAVFFDIDGTIQTFENPPRIPESTMIALRKMKEKGIKLFIATGRPKCALEDFQKICDFEFDGWVTMNGQYVYTKDQLIRSLTIPSVQLEPALNYLESHSIFSNFATQERIVSNSSNYPEFAYKGEVWEKKQILDHNIYQMMVYLEEGNPEEEGFFDILTSCKSARWHPSFMDVIPKDGGKNKGIDAILEHFGIPLAETIAFGDGGNDIAMLEHVAIGIAMGNARDNVKEKADYVTSNIEDNGIYNACKYFGII